MDRAVALIVNPNAGGGRAAEALPVVEATLTRLGLRFHTERTTSLEHAQELARVAVAAGETVAALSGDGLIGKLAGELAGTDGVLAVLPGGRGNDLARALDIPHDPEAAAQVLATGRIRELDLGEVDGRPYIGIASCGFDSDANRIANEAPPALGNLVYAYGALRALAAWKPARFELTLDGRGLAFSGYSVAVANSPRYGGGMYMAPSAELDDGMLEVRVEEHRVRPMIRCSVWTNATWCGASARWSRAPTTGCLGLHQQTPRAKQLRLETEIIVLQAERRHAE